MYGGRGEYTSSVIFLRVIFSPSYRGDLSGQDCPGAIVQLILVCLEVQCNDSRGLKKETKVQRGRHS